MTDQLSDEQKAAFEQELEDTSVKALLIQQNALLQQILSQLTDATDDDTERLECRMCGESYPRNKLVEHARDAHNAPGDMGVDDVAKA